ncbi:hypothetical protein H4J58_08250 [Colwellia sp. MB3u-70]|uniref:hypothetical protein n=1 Tax=unclassified Colwellia TaxID=196834 RepID=UPI0015F68E55|nr:MULTISPECIES: hypothetical protein [unclassified Colwellia]MBA6293123.1 hypothetical protein [Colwellia sp. MB3u-8]MBA6307105.1 hypothetical protein [Colwellia sp. MB3u-70]
MSHPKIMLGKPEPKNSVKSFHGKKIIVWQGLANVSNINGWVQNPRIDLEIKRFKDNHAGIAPNSEEVFAIMKAIKEFKIKDLAKDVLCNGIRQPIIITHEGKLLDGNRRYYSIRSILESMDRHDPLRSEFEQIPVWVLDDQCTAEDEEYILVQENFYAAQKVEWPDYVKAHRIYEDLQNELPIKSVAQKYGWNTSKVAETKRIMELIEEFVMFATGDCSDEDEYAGLGLSEIEAEKIAAEKYQYFNEAQKSFRVKLEQDPDFKFSFFRLIFEGKFKNFTEVRAVKDAWDTPQARNMLLSNDPKAAKKAKAIVDYKSFESKEEENVEETIDDFVSFLSKLTTEQKINLVEKDTGYVEKLQSSLNTVLSMIEQVKKC